MTKWKRILKDDCRDQRAKLSQEQAPKKVDRLFKKVSKQLGAVKLKRSGWSALAPGIKRSYRDGRRGYELACKRGTPEDFHEWRKRVKDLYYQIGLLCPIWPEQMSATEAELKHLGECLGDDHDLFMLTEIAASKRMKKLATEETEAVHGLCQQRQKELRAKALAIGVRFYEEKPALFCKRLGQYWKRWRREPKRLTAVS